MTTFFVDLLLYLNIQYCVCTLIGIIGILLHHNIEEMETLGFFYQIIIGVADHCPVLSCYHEFSIKFNRS